MKRMRIEKLADHVDELVAAAPVGGVLLTKNGKPFAIVSDATAYDEEDIGYVTDPKFWQMIALRRQGEKVPLEVIEKRMKAAEARQVTARKSRSRK